MSQCSSLCLCIDSLSHSCITWLGNKSAYMYTYIYIGVECKPNRLTSFHLPALVTMFAIDPNIKMVQWIGVVLSSMKWSLRTSRDRLLLQPSAF